MFASRLAESNQSGILTVDGNVSTVTVLPEVNRTSQSPDAHGVNDRDVTSPQIYLVFASAVIVGAVPETETVALVIKSLSFVKSDVFVGTTLVT